MAGIQFILGRSGTGKTRWCIDHICQTLAEPGDRPLVLLVPEQATYQAERAILSKPGIEGFSRLKVVSFERLQYLLTGKAGSGAELSHTAKQMILHKVLLELSGQLTLFKGDLQRTGLAGKFASLLTDLQADNCTARQIELMAESLTGKSGQELACAKWTDISRVFSAYEAFFESFSGYVNPDMVLKNACPQAANAAFLKGASLWVDGFSGFSGQERDLLIELLKVCDSASIALCLDPEGFDADNEDTDKLDPYSLFASAEQTCCQLVRIIRRLKLTLNRPVRLQNPLRFAKSPALAVIEENMARGTETPSCPAGEAIQVAGCSTIRAEAFFVAESISDLVRRHNLRYRDIAVVLPEMETYPHYIESAFREFAIPYFLDRPRRMKNHPLVELIGSALQAVLRRFTLSDVLSFLKCGLAGIEPDEADLLETYTRAFDIQGAEWTRPEAWNFAGPEDVEKQRYDQAHLDQCRRRAMEPLQELHYALSTKKEMTAGEFLKTIWALLEALNVPQRLAQWAAADTTDQQYGHRQLYEKLIELFDQMHRVFGEIQLPAQNWASILNDAFSTLTIKLIPPKLDQTLVGSIERSRHPDIQVIFLMGAAQKHFPVPPAAESLLTEKDYQAAAGLELSSPARLELTHRPYLAYIALTRASKKIVLSYPMFDEKGAAVVPWSGIEMLKRLFFDLQISTPGLSQSPEKISTPGLLAQWLCARLGRDRQMDCLTETAAGVLECLRTAGQTELRQIAESVERALLYENDAALDHSVIGRVYKFPLTVSASRLQTFAACPYHHFAKYVLHLEPRQRLGFEPLDLGSFYHRVLEEMFRAMQAEGKTWADIENAALDALCEHIVGQIASQDPAIVNFIRRKAHHKCIVDSAAQTIRAFVPMLGELSRAGAFRQAAAELKIDPKVHGPFLTLDGGRVVNLTGKIDRLDLANIEGKTLGIVFDYKSGGKAVDYARMFYGLDLQLPIYLLAVRMTHRADGAVPVGAFYLPIDGGFAAGRLSELDTAAAGVNKAKGLFDGGCFTWLDGGAGPSKSSRFYNFRVSKEGEPYSDYGRQGALRPEDFQAVLAYAGRAIGQLIERMSDGSVQTRPYRLGTQSPCPHCDFRPLCRFDWQINEYNILQPCDKESVLEKMKDMTS